MYAIKGQLNNTVGFSFLAAVAGISYLNCNQRLCAAFELIMHNLMKRKASAGRPGTVASLAFNRIKSQFQSVPECVLIIITHKYRCK